MKTRHGRATCGSSTRAARTTCTQRNGLLPLPCRAGSGHLWFVGRLGFNPHNLSYDRRHRCHGDDGQGQKVAGRYVFPPLWGGDSYNWGAGMHQLDNAAGFIKANMPFGRGGSLSDQQAWDVAMFMNAHERPQDPRFKGDLAATRRQFHDDPNSLYGLEVDGRLLGADPAR